MKTLLMILSAISTTPALASATPLEMPQAVVKYDDLNLNSAAGAAALRRRVDHTVVNISGGDSAPVDIQARVELSRARAEGRSQADRLIAAASKDRSAIALSTTE